MKNNKNILLKCLYILMLYFAIYNTAFVFFPKGVYISRLMLPLVFGYALLSCRRVQFKIFSPLVLYSLYALWVLIMTAVQKFSDNALLISVFLTLFHIIPLTWSLAVIAKKWKMSTAQIIAFVHFIIVLQALFVIADYWIPTFRNMTIVLMGNMSGNIDYTVAQDRARGLVGGGASLSAFLAIGVFSSIFLFTANILKPKSKIKVAWGIYLTISFIFILGGIFFSGRVGFLAIPLATIYLLYSVIKSGKKMRTGFLFTLFLFCSLFLILTIPENILFDNPAAIRFARDFNPGSDRPLHTVNILYNHHIFFPNDFFDFFFGDVRTWKSNPIPSDIGYIRRLHSIGIIGCLLFYGFLSYLFISSYKTSDNFDMRGFIAILGLWIFILEAKEPMGSKFSFITLFVLFYFVLQINKKSHLLKKGQLRK